MSIKLVSRTQEAKASQEKRLRDLHDDKIRRKKQRARRERAMKLLLEMAENHSDKSTVQGSLIGTLNRKQLRMRSRAMEDAFQQTKGREMRKGRCAGGFSEAGFDFERNEREGNELEMRWRLMRYLYCGWADSKKRLSRRE